MLTCFLKRTAQYQDVVRLVKQGEPGMDRLCPKLTDQHICLTNLKNRNVKMKICGVKVNFVLELYLENYHQRVGVIIPPVKIIEAALMSPPKCLRGFPSHIIPHILVHILYLTTLLTYHMLHDIIYIMYHVSDCRESAPQSSCRAAMMRGPGYWTGQQRNG